MSDLVASVSLHFIAGTDVELEFTVTDSEGPVNLAGMDIAFVAKRDEVVLSSEDSSQSAAITVTDTAGGVFRVAVSADDTASLSGTYKFQVMITDGQGKTTPVARGYLTFSENLLSVAS